MKKILQYLTTWKFWKELLIMTVGMSIAAAAVYAALKVMSRRKER